MALVRYSTPEINFTPREIISVTAKILDENNIQSIRSSQDIATEITQLLIDIKAQDDSNLSDWVNANEGQVPPESVKKIRMKSFLFILKARNPTH